MTEAAPGLVKYRLDAAASTFKVQAFAEGLLSAFGHDPVIGVKEFQGEASFVVTSPLIQMLFCVTPCNVRSPMKRAR